jgi:hypothetical protein
MFLNNNKMEYFGIKYFNVVEPKTYSRQAICCLALGGISFTSIARHIDGDEK